MPPKPVAPCALRTALLALLLLLPAAGCDLFAPRTPEAPIDTGGTYVQPDTPEQVVENLTNAIRELNTLNYRRSLAEALVFVPTATAADDPVFANWSQSEEDRYFSTLTAAAQAGAGNGLTLNDQTFTALSEDRFLLDATYVLTINHRRPDVPTTVQGRLVWLLAEGDDGLWRLQEWTDQELGANPAWSDLKAEFVK